MKRYTKNKVRQNTQKAIKHWEKKYNRELTPQEKKDFYIDEQRKLRVENKRKLNRLKLRIAAGALSISAFLAGMQLQKINHYFQQVHLEAKLLQKFLITKTNLEIV